MEFQIPTAGRIVHFFPPSIVLIELQGALKLPAIVVDAEENGNAILSVFTPTAHQPVVLQADVPHKSKADVDAGMPYWDWPELPKKSGSEDKATFPLDEKQPGGK